MNAAELKSRWVRLTALFADERADPRLTVLLQVTLGLAVFVVVEPLALACRGRCRGCRCCPAPQ